MNVQIAKTSLKSVLEEIGFKDVEVHFTENRVDFQCSNISLNSLIDYRNIAKSIKESNAKDKNLLRTIYSLDLFFLADMKSMHDFIKRNEGKYFLSIESIQLDQVASFIPTVLLVKKEENQDDDIKLSQQIQHDFVRFYVTLTNALSKFYQTR